MEASARDYHAPSRYGIRVVRIHAFGFSISWPSGLKSGAIFFLSFPIGCEDDGCLDLGDKESRGVKSEEALKRWVFVPYLFVLGSDMRLILD